MKPGQGVLFAPDSPDVSPSPQRAVQIARKRGQFEPEVLAPRAKREQKAPPARASVLRQPLG